ncbi:MAG: hypothetical protein JST89_11685 [Cyanobacteria bacterium SZAS-4]|nr:hypothetical protein [Cyanobacteria bacterium SZAS-4]
MTKMHEYKRIPRSNRASVLLELSCSCFMMLVFTILSADLGVLIYGAEFNDRACRDAARAAAQGQDAQQSARLIRAILKAHRGDGNYITAPTLQNVVYNDYGGNPPPQVAPFVSVTTSTVAKAPFAPLVFFQGPVFLENGSFKFSQTYTFPIVKTK